MHKHLHEYGPAPEPREREARERFPFQTMPPAEYAAREGHNWHCFSFDDYIYQDAALNEWIHTLGDILFTKGALAEARRKYLTADEIRAIEDRANEPSLS